MALKLGRVDVSDTEVVNFDGDRKLHLAGDLHAATIGDAKALRQQVLGLADVARNEDVFPVTWSEDSSIDGYYRLVNPPQTSTVEASYATNWFRYSADLIRVDGGSQLPGIESTIQGGYRRNKDAGVTASFLHGVPSTTKSYDPGDGSMLSALSRTGPGGTAHIYRGNTFKYTHARWRIPPASYYEMAATVTVGGYTAVGAQVASAGNETTWTLENGLVQVTAATGANELIKVRGADNAGSGWGVYTTYKAGTYTALYGWATSWLAIKGVEVVRTSPECSIIRLVCGHTYPFYAGVAEAVVELRLRRGSYIVEGAILSAGGNIAPGIGRADLAAHTNATGVLRPSANDADGNRWCMFTNTATTTSGLTGTPGGGWATGQLVATANIGAFDFGLGYERLGSSAVDPNRYTDLRDQYNASGDEVVTIGQLL